ncbi:hypothetical protein ABT354_02705 [Streptomyces sp. NPDC000594]|uniref:hypothetical protein n=1 Tax=Streptomyces sp. NPDC000594 TaxID=3154261 RepID=UPI0033273D49
MGSGGAPAREAAPAGGDRAGRAFRLTETPGATPYRQVWRAVPTDATRTLAGCHRTGDGPSVPAVLWLECAAEAALALLPGPVVALSGVRFPRGPLPLPPDRAPALWVGVWPPARPGSRSPAAVRVAIGTAPPGRDFPGTAARELIAEATVHIGPLPPAPAPLPLPRRPALPSRDPAREPGGPILLSGPFTALTGVRRHSWGGSGEFTPGDGAAVAAGLLLPVLAVDCLLRMESQPPLSRGFLLPVYAPLRLALVEFFTPYDDRALGGLPVVLLHTPVSAPGTGVLNATGPGHRPVLRITGAANRLLGRFDARARRWEVPGGGRRHPSKSPG